MDFNKPLLFIYAARGFDENAGVADIPHFVGLLHGHTRFPAKGGKGSGDRFDVGHAVRDLGQIP
jgi:hypothetical protein